MFVAKIASFLSIGSLFRSYILRNQSEDLHHSYQDQHHAELGRSTRIKITGTKININELDNAPIEDENGGPSETEDLLVSVMGNCPKRFS
jgi:hypothetical protein